MRDSTGFSFEGDHDLAGCQDRWYRDRHLPRLRDAKQKYTMDINANVGENGWVCCLEWNHGLALYRNRHCRRRYSYRQIKVILQRTEKKYDYLLRWSRENWSHGHLLWQRHLAL